MAAIDMIFKRVARLVLGEYAAYRIYAHDAGPGRAPLPAGVRFAPLDVADVQDHPSAALRALAAYAGADAYAFGLWRDAMLVGGCYFWTNPRYATERAFWPLADNEAKLVQVTISPDQRGRGFGNTLIEQATAAMHDRGFPRVFARIWHNHHASRAAFERAGWHKIALVVTVQPLGLRRPLRFLRRHPAHATHLPAQLH